LTRLIDDLPPAPDLPGHAEHGVVHIASDEEAAEVQIIELDGEFDMANVQQLDRAVEQGIDAGARDFVADLHNVEFLDATAVHALLRGWKRAARRNGRFVLVDPPAPIWRVFVLIGVARPFTTFATREEALRYLAGTH
jgi:anti-anti-sigma factor